MNVVKIPADRINEFLVEAGPIKMSPRTSLHGWGVLPMAVLNSSHLTEQQKLSLAGFEQIEFNVSDFESDEA